MPKFKNLLISTVIVIAAVTASLLFVGCDDGSGGHGGNDVPSDTVTYAVTYDLNGGTGTTPTQKAAAAGETFTLALADGLSCDGFEFGGWNDGAVTYAAGATYTMPSHAVTFTAQWISDDSIVRIFYVDNLNGIPCTGTIAAHKGKEGDRVAVADGADYNVEEDYLFLGWTTAPDAVIEYTDGTHDGQYFVGDSIVLGDTDVRLYAQWAKGYSDSKGVSSDKIYIYDALVGQGLGAATLVRSGKPDKLGFVKAASETDSGYAEVQFMFDAADGGDVLARIVDDGYVLNDGTTGIYAMYDYVTGDTKGYMLTTDGYGNAILTQLIGDIQHSEFGYYEYDAKYGDYLFVFIDPTTGRPILTDDGEERIMHFAIEKQKIESTELNGYFIQQGWESGSYVLYVNGELSYNYMLNLNGYGGAQWYELDPVQNTSTLIAEGSYAGTDNYEDYSGEWHFTATDGSAGFDFILNIVSGVSGSVPVYIEHDPTLEKLFTEVDNEQNTLYLDGYGSARYVVGGQTHVGYCSVNATKTLVTFVPYFEDGDTVTTGGKMYFDVDFTAGTFSVNTDGYVVDNGVLVEYRGESSIIVVPSGVTEIADYVFRYDAETGFYVTHVTIAASVVGIGKNAFENNRTLHRVTFLSETPIDIDFSAANNPFRWPAGDFVIVVPEGSVQAYKEAWTDCPYAIKGSEEVNRLEEFEVVDGVLVRYNKPQDSGDALDIKLPDGVTAIADRVFIGLEYIRSVDLNGVTEIGESAFEGCVNLTTIIANNLTHIGEGAFLDCWLLGSNTDGTLELPQIIELGDNAFRGCSSLRLVRLGDGIRSIGTLAFSECNIYLDDPPICVELMGSELPQMSEKIFTGNIAFRLKVQSFEIAKKFYDSPAYRSYCASLYIESGDEAGKYIDGSVMLEIDGRAMLMGSVVMIYKIEGSTITLLDYDNTTMRYDTIVGTVSAGTISFTYGGVAYSFTKMNGDDMVYTSDDGLYTLVCNPEVFNPENYDNYKGTATVMFNGVQAELFINGYNTKTIRMFTDTDGKKYDINITLGTGTVFTYTKTLSNYYVSDITADDGSKITLHFTGTAIYIYGELKAEIATGISLLPDTSSDYSYSVTQVSDNVFTFVRAYSSNKYIVTLTFSQDMTAFTYSYELV